VYRGVCATCHSLNRIAFRNMDGVCYTSQEIKDMAAEVSGSAGASARFPGWPRQSPSRRSDRPLFD